MKSWLSTFSAVLLAALIIFAWSRSITMWESRAERQAATIRETVDRAGQAAKMDGDILPLILKTEISILDSRVTRANMHLKAFAPMRDESLLQLAVISAIETQRELRAALDAHTKAAAAARAAQEKAAAAAHARTLEGWTEIAERQVEEFKSILASLPFLQGEALKAKRLELDAAVVAAANHLKVAPGWSDPEPLRLMLARATQTAGGQ